MKKLFEVHYGEAPESIFRLKPSASNRSYWRLSSSRYRCIGVEGCDKKENEAFIAIAGHFRSKGIYVPEVYAVSDDRLTYIQEDIGDDVLFDKYKNAVKLGEGVREVEELLCSTMSILPKIQFEGADGLEFSICHPQPEFDRRMVLFDLNYFKYCFLKPSGLEFDEILLQNEFERLTDELTAQAGNTFLYRDFNARNVMVRGGHPCFIDFQGGRRGPIYYDVASFVYHSRADYPAELQDRMLETYLVALGKYMEVDRDCFFENLTLFRMLRLFQVLGAYGFRGLIEQKADFVTAIPSALNHLKDLVVAASTKYPYLAVVMRGLVSLPRFSSILNEDGILEVTVTSFSYRKGIPADPSGNGGGYVFDCRSINNPGRYNQYKALTGMDEPVIRYLEEDGEVFGFLEHVYGVADLHIETFIRRSFTSLMVSFGCTGGQHRSVYCAEHFASHVAQKYPSVRVRLVHREQGINRIV